MTNLYGRYFGQAKPLFYLTLKTTLLTFVTLGIYRFWAKTRIRQFVWSSTQANDDRFEYTGTGLEKFLGFLIAMVILAVYLGLIQMVLFFFGIVTFTAPTTEAAAIGQVIGVYVTFLAVLPLVFFARYRARRYKLARTRWRGIRFGAEAAGWRYALHALGHLALTVLTLGILLPRMTFKLEKFVTDRSWYGDAQFQQNGRWQALYPGLKWLAIGFVVIVVSGAAAFAIQAAGLFVIGTLVGYVIFLIGAIYYRIYAFNYTTRNKVLDGEITFFAAAKTGEVAKHVIVGGLLVSLALAVPLLIIGAIVATTAESMVLGGNLGIGAIIVITLLYLAILAFGAALSMIWITQPIIAHMVKSIEIRNAEHLATIRQRAGDDGADAEGFADALDVGGGI